MANSAARLAHAQLDDQEAASIGAKVDPKTGHWIDLKDGHYIPAAEADQRLGRTTAQGNADRAQGNGGGFTDQLVDRNQNFAGNLVKNLAPIAGVAASVLSGGALTPLMAGLIGGGGAALGDAAEKGHNLGNALTSGVQNGLLASGGASLAGATGLTGAVGGTNAAGTAAKMAADGTLGSVADASAPLTGQAATDIGGMTAGSLGSAAGAAGNAAGNAVGGAAGGSGLPFGLTAGDLLKGIGGVASGAANYAESQAALDEKKREFNQSYGLQSNQQQMQAQGQLNRAPLADMAQYGALHNAAPTAFQPRDYTASGGLNALSTPATGGPANQLAANAITQAGYTPGAGGVDTSTLQAILNRLKGATG